MDYAREAQNAKVWTAQMAALGVDGVVTADVVDSLTGDTVLVTRWVSGVGGCGRAWVGVVLGGGWGGGGGC